jgi:hypothetical protein
MRPTLILQRISAFYRKKPERKPNRKNWLNYAETLLEERQLLTAYAISSSQWVNKNLITYSIAPDGVFWYAGTNQINADLTRELGTDWQRAVAEVIDQWTRVADIDIAEVADKGGFGDYQVASQGASQFGDIRIGGYHFNENPLRILALASSPPPDGWTRAGDIQLNLDNNWSEGAAYDFRTVLLHELGHSLGLDHAADTNSIMYERYMGVRRDLQPGDIEGIQAIYGKRRDDSLTLSGAGTSQASSITAPTPAQGQRSSQTGKMELAASGAADYATRLYGYKHGNSGHRSRPEHAQPCLGHARFFGKCASNKIDPWQMGRHSQSECWAR